MWSCCRCCFFRSRKGESSKPLMAHSGRNEYQQSTEGDAASSSNEPANVVSVNSSFASALSQLQKILAEPGKLQAYINSQIGIRGQRFKSFINDFILRNGLCLLSHDGHHCYSLKALLEGENIVQGNQLQFGVSEEQAYLTAREILLRHIPHNDFVNFILAFFPQNNTEHGHIVLHHMFAQKVLTEGFASNQLIRDIPKGLAFGFSYVSSNAMNHQPSQEEFGRVDKGASYSKVHSKETESLQIRCCIIQEKYDLAQDAELSNPQTGGSAFTLELTKLPSGAMTLNVIRPPQHRRDQSLRKMASQMQLYEKAAASASCRR